MNFGQHFSTSETWMGVIGRQWSSSGQKGFIIFIHTIVFSLMEPKDRMKSSHSTRVGWPILLVGVALRSYVFNILSMILRSESRSRPALDLEKRKVKNVQSKVNSLEIPSVNLEYSLFTLDKYVANSPQTLGEKEKYQYYIASHQFERLGCE